MWSAAAAVARAGRGRLVVARLLNATRGWGSDAAPVRDAHWALDRLADRFGPLPTSLVGHSLGGRAALVAADRDEVRSAVALAAWVLPGDARRVRDRQILFVHGTADRVAPPARAAGVARDLEAANQVSFVRLDGAGHALLREAWQVDALAADFARATVLDVPPRLASTRRALHRGSEPVDGAGDGVEVER
jgi:pimeloyl-ACP methyl ester carboxylesterase